MSTSQAKLDSVRSKVSANTATQPVARIIADITIYMYDASGSILDIPNTVRCCSISNKQECQ